MTAAPDRIERIELPFPGPEPTGSGRIATSEGGLGLHVRRWEGEERVPVLLVHGLASNARLWDGVAPVLAAAGHPVAAVDLRGHGRSDKPDGGYDVATVAADLVALVDVLGWDRPVVAGQSWGGNVVVELAARWPDAVAAVAGIDGGAIHLRHGFPTWEACAEALRPPPLTGTPLAEVERWLRQAHPDWPESGVQGQLACLEVRDDGTVAPWLTLDRHLAALRGLWEHEPLARMAEVAAPTLLVGAGDGTEGGSPMQDLAAAAGALPRGRVVHVPGDHDLHAQHPERVAALLGELAAEAEGA